MSAACGCNPCGMKKMEIEEALELIKTQKTEIETGKAEVASMQAKLDELLGETKRAKQKAKEEAEAAEKAKADKARQDNDFEQLLKSSEAEREKLNSQLGELVANVSKERINSTAMKMASELADGHNAGILSEFIGRRLKSTNEGVKVLDVSGELTVSTLDQLKTEFQTDERYKALVRGNQASGGGAPGGSGSAETKNPFKKGEDFNLTKQAELLKADPAKAAALKASA